MSQEVWSDRKKQDWLAKRQSASGGDVVSHWGLGTALTPHHVLCPNLKNTNTEIHKCTNTQRLKHKHRDSNYTQVAMWSVSQELELAAPPTYFALRLFLIHCFTFYTWPVATRQQYTALYLPRHTLLLLEQKPDNTTYWRHPPRPSAVER